MKVLRVLLGISMVAIALCSCTRTASKVETSPPTVTSTEKTENVEAVVTHLENKWTMAVLMKDARRLESLIADDFAGTSPSAHTYTKSDAIDELKSGKRSIRAMNLNEISVNVFGDMAVAFTNQEEKRWNDGKDARRHYRYTDVWVKRDGKWKLVASQGSRFEEQSPSEPKNK